MLRVYPLSMALTEPQACATAFAYPSWLPKGAG